MRQENNLVEEQMMKFFAIARERERIFLQKSFDDPKPWTKDEIFKNFRFCNVCRSDDKVSKHLQLILNNYLKENILQAIVIARWFNKVETISLLHEENLMIDWNKEKAVKVLTGIKDRPVFTGAYIIKSPNGKSKIEGICDCIGSFVDRRSMENRKFPWEGIMERKDSTLEGMVEYLSTYAYIGKFMAYQIVCDLIDVGLASEAPDRHTWAQLGPGSARGLGRMFYGDPDKFSYNSNKDLETCLSLMRELLKAAPSYSMLEWEMQTIQHWLCEYDKYRRAEEGGKLKRRYV